MHTSNYRHRFDAVFLFFILFLLFCLSRLFYIQFFRGRYLKEIARKQHSLFVELEPRRGSIYDANLKPQAINIAADSLFAVPNEIRDSEKENLIRQLSPVLRVDPAYLRDRLYRKKSFIWLARKLSAEQSQTIRDLKLKGIDFMKETRRSYPNGYLASHVIGFAGLDNTGLAGIEMLYDAYLRGEPGWAITMRDARQKRLDLLGKMVSPKDGYDIILTIDEIVQYIAERELEKAVRTHHARGGSIVVMNPHTGAILAMANRPTYDLNEYGRSDKDALRNRTVCDMFEPGSVFKIVTASAALEEKKVVEDNKFFCENGSYRVAGHVLHDHRPHGWLTFREVIEQSSNIGTSKVAQLLGNELVYRYIKLFGFGAKTGIDLPGEINGVAREPRFWSKLSIAIIPMGQEVGVTALQLACAVSVIANGGQLMKPYVVSQARDRYGALIKEYPPVMIRKVISLETAERVKKILTGAIETGTGKLAQVPGFSVAGKTGTAQKLEPNGSYSHDKYMGSFIGFAPADDPLIAIAVIIDEPRPYYFGGVVAAPVFKAVAADAVRYLKTKHPLVHGRVFHEAKAGY